MKVRHWKREAIRAGRKADRIAKGIVLDAIVAVGRRNGVEDAERCCRDDASVHFKYFDLIGASKFGAKSHSRDRRPSRTLELLHFMCSYYCPFHLVILDMFNRLQTYNCLQFVLSSTNVMNSKLFCSSSSLTFSGALCDNDTQTHYFCQTTR